MSSKMESGRVIDVHTARVLRRNLSRKKVTEIANGMENIAGSTIRDVMYQNNPLTENNRRGLEAAMLVAYAEAKEEKERRKEDMDYLIDELDMSEEDILASAKEILESTKTLEEL